jgi:hypothetical protein
MVKIDINKIDKEKIAKEQLKKSIKNKNRLLNDNKIVTK